jgi:hypothetical protein
MPQVQGQLSKGKAYFNHGTTINRKVGVAKLGQLCVIITFIANKICGIVGKHNILIF